MTLDSFIDGLSPAEALEKLETLKNDVGARIPLLRQEVVIAEQKALIEELQARIEELEAKEEETEVTVQPA